MQSCILDWLPRPESSTFFPYTTLFRSPLARDCQGAILMPHGDPMFAPEILDPEFAALAAGPARPIADKRSEEHTSELQSHVNLVCRLLLEKKKIWIS